jgi:hypothetical protein
VPIKIPKQAQALQAGENLIKLREISENHSSGAEAPTHFAVIIGTTKVVP